MSVLPFRPRLPFDRADVCTACGRSRTSHVVAGQFVGCRLVLPFNVVRRRLRLTLARCSGREVVPFAVGLDEPSLDAAPARREERREGGGLT